MDEKDKRIAVLEKSLQAANSHIATLNSQLKRFEENA
jgi:hypothetical protein